jgi:hypothetical protein
MKKVLSAILACACIGTLSAQSSSTKVSVSLGNLSFALDSLTEIPPVDNPPLLEVYT